jgi:hypothetical protein
MPDGYTALVRIADFAMDLAEIPETQAVHDDLTSVLQDLLEITSVVLLDPDGRLLSLATTEPVSVPQVDMLRRLVTSALASSEDVIAERDLSDLTTEGSTYGRQAAEHGIRSLAVVPVHVAGTARRCCACAPASPTTGPTSRSAAPSACRRSPPPSPRRRSGSAGRPRSPRSCSTPSTPAWSSSRPRASSRPPRASR